MTDAMARSDANGAVVTTARVAEEVRIYAHLCSAIAVVVSGFCVGAQVASD